MYCEGTADILDVHGCRVDTHVFIYTHTLQVLPIHFGRETVPSVHDHRVCVDEGLDGSALFPSAIIILVIFFIIAWHW